MSVHYKFKSALEYDTVTFDGLHISIKDLKNAIIQQKRIGKNTDFDLQVTNAQTKEVYEDENALIPKNTSLLIARIPTAAQTKNKQWEGYGGDSTPPMKLDEGGPIAKAVDLSSLDAPEDDKIKAMMSQSTQDYDPSNYMKIRGANQMGAVPPNYRCYKCHQTGHWIKDCPLSKGPEPMEIKKSTGIPLSFMVPVEGPQVPGAMMTPNGSYAVPVLDHQTYNTQKQSNPVPTVLIEEKLEIPDDLLCSICSDLLTDAVMIPCCGNSFCDECIRNVLLESEEHECPDCHEKGISPGTLIPNRFLRNSVGNFKNTTGYVKKPNYKQHVKFGEPIKKIEIEEKTIISEADSTEHSKTEELDKLNESKVEVKKIKDDDLNSEGPPGVSPNESPKQQITKRVNSSREKMSSSIRHKRRSGDESPLPRRTHRHRSPPYNDGRPDTPTVDEPSFSAAPSGPLPNFHLPPPGTAPPPTFLATGPYGVPPRPMFDASRPPPPSTATYLPPGPYGVPSRPIFDASRPPIGGPPQSIYNVNTNYGQRHHGRDFNNTNLNERRTIRDSSNTPSSSVIIDDPLAAFNRMLREKDERERRKRNRRFQHNHHHHHNNNSNYSRSRSRSFSRSPPPSLRRIRSSHSPRRRHSRSRSRSFSISRSRSRSFSGSPFREFSPRHSPPRHRRGHSRYRSPIRSPPRHQYQERFRERDYDREHERDYNRSDERGFNNREHSRHHRNMDKERNDYNYFDSNYDDKRNKNQWQQQQQNTRTNDGFYTNEMQHYSTNRYPPTRDYPVPYMNKPELATNVIQLPIQQQQPQQRRYDDVAPPGVEEPPVPGLEPELNPITLSTSPIRNDSPLLLNIEKAKSPKHQSKSKDVKETSPDKHHKRKRYDSSDKDNQIKKSDDEKLKKSKERKKKKDKKDTDKKKRKEKKEKHRKHSKDDENDEKIINNLETNKKSEEKQCLYDDMEIGIDAKIFENYGKLNENSDEKTIDNREIIANPEPVIYETTEQPINKDEDILEIHTDLDLKTDLIDTKNEMLAQLPEKSKWEVDDDNLLLTSPKNSNNDDNKTTIDKFGNKVVTNEVLKRAENAIFAKAINAIRPIEIKKISLDRAKLYSNEQQEEQSGTSVAMAVATTTTTTTATTNDKNDEKKEPTRVSVKDRLGVKVDDNNDKLPDRNKSKSISPFSKRGNETNRNYAIGERRVEIVEKKRDERNNRYRDNRRSPLRRDYRRNDYRNRDQRHHSRHDNSRNQRRNDNNSNKRSRSKHYEEEKKRKRTRSRSVSGGDDKKRRKKDKKPKKEKSKKHESEMEKKTEKSIVETNVKASEEIVKKKATIDESNFEPDYDLESESEKEVKNEVAKKIVEEKKSSSSSDSSDSSTDDDKKKKKHKKHKKKKTKSSSSSDTESETSDDDGKKRKKHKKKQKKRKKSKHK